MSDTALTVIDAQSTPENPAALMRQATDVAGVCREIVIRTACNIQNRKYVKCEGWMSIATAHGCIASSRNVQRVEGGWTAIGEIRRISDGVLLSQAEGYVGKDEKRWGNADEYACRAMAQTRAISRACRAAFAHVVVLIDGGLSTTPFEEVPEGGFENAKPSRKPWPRPTGPHADDASFEEAAKPTTPAVQQEIPATQAKAFKGAGERSKWLSEHLSKCRTALTLQTADEPAAFIKFLKKSDLLMPNETMVANINLTTLFPSVPLAPDDRESDADWKARVNEAIAKDAKAIKDRFAAFLRGDQLDGAEAPEPEPTSALPVGARELSGFIKLVNKKPIAKGGTRYGILVVQDMDDREGGEFLNTFDDKDGAEAERLKGQEAAFAYTESKYGKDLCKHAIREVR